MLASHSLFSAHLVGGELSYECVGNSRYAIRMVVYRDCASAGAPFDNPAIITIYNGNNQFIDNRRVRLASQNRLPIIAPNNCTSLPPFVCTEKAVYRDTVYLPPTSSGYVISYQRCCRNASITNIPNPDTWGNTFTITIPPNDTRCNSSPRFNVAPPVALCLNIPVNIDVSASETDGDSVAYSLCNIFHGGGNGAAQGPLSPRPDTALPPPYRVVPFAPGFSSSNPIRSNPQFTVDPVTGRLTGTPTQVGQFVFAICAKEYRNGRLVSTLRRDFQFNVTNRCTGVAAVIRGQNVDSSTLCTGETINFTEQSLNANRWFWDFGDPTTNTDTSTKRLPSYTYPDTGVYTVMLIANPGSSCADTTFEDFRVFDAVSISFTTSGQACFDVHSFNFNVQGRFSNFAEITWDFGGLTNLGRRSTERSPQNVTYVQPGNYLVRVQVEDFKCRASYSDSVLLYARPVLRHQVPSRTACLPVRVQFVDSSSYFGRALHFWDFGDGNYSTDRSPSHVYREPGTYTVYHRLTALEGCKDTLEETFPAHIVAYPVPLANLQITPQKTSIYEPVFSLQNLSDSTLRSWTYLPNGETIDDLRDTKFEGRDTGIYVFYHVVMNEFGCSDTLRLERYIEPPINFFIPNSFTPNGDGRNERFEFIITGVSGYKVYIFNRWGELVFESNENGPFWDGRSQKNGEKVPGGVYTYLIKADVDRRGKLEVRQGHLKLIR